ncbi:MAG: hypothetical protein CSB13_01325 [Chloroflexi bacterium]|nr:MAG: hypothetical protein CSB13_01325 [Chloroflexota bacterium]
MFKSAKQVTAFAGLIPRQLQFGQMHHYGSIYKLGSCRLRNALYFPAMTGCFTIRFFVMWRND